ncbi:MAG: hypothetical protein Q9171_004952 [Xanthocarpia ochracea]
MPSRESSSPARRPQLTERSPSTNSLSRASPSTGKGSTTRSLKAHAVGHGRHPHSRVPSHGRNLNKLSKLASSHPHDDADKSKLQSKAKVQTPSTSPSEGDAPNTSSSVNLVRTNSKASMKRNASNLSQKRNKSSSKLGNLTKTGKAGSERKGTNRAVSSSAQFSIGSDDQDEEWTEADSSQSPITSRHGPVAKGKTQFGDPLSPDQPPLRSPTKLPASPPQSPPIAESNGPLPHPSKHDQQSSAPYSREPDAEAVTRRLLDRNTASNAKPLMSAVSATITPSGSSGSPAFNFSQEAALSNDQSMPSDGVSRFLDANGSLVGSVTPHSPSQLHPGLVGTHREHEHQGNGQTASPGRNGNTAGDRSRRARSTADLTLTNEQQRPISQSSSPPSQHSPRSTVLAGRSSRFASTRDLPSRTQQKLDLQRMSTNREPAHAPAVQPPIGGAHPSFANVSIMGNEVELAKKKNEEWERAVLEYRNGRKFVGILAKGAERLQKRGKLSGAKDGKDDVKERDGGRRSERNTVVSTSAESRPASRGRIRFEIGGRHGDERNDGDTDSDGGGLEGLMRRMWEGDGQSGGED